MIIIYLSTEVPPSVKYEYNYWGTSGEILVIIIYLSIEVPPSVPYITPGAPLEKPEDDSSSSSSSDDEGQNYNFIIVV